MYKIYFKQLFSNNKTSKQQQVQDHRDEIQQAVSVFGRGAGRGERGRSGGDGHAGGGVREVQEPDRGADRGIEREGGEEQEAPEEHQGTSTRTSLIFKVF